MMYAFMPNPQHVGSPVVVTEADAPPDDNPNWLDVTKVVPTPTPGVSSFDGKVWVELPAPTVPLTETQVLAALLVVQGDVSLSDAAAVVDASPAQLTAEAQAWSVAVQTKG
jgi:hypothetical protein